MHESAPATASIPLVDATDAEAGCLSQRERNRRETWLAIHRAAFALASEHGFEGATVEQIAEQAGVSRRTFFNYFPSKEDAVLGLVPAHCPEEALAAFRAAEGDPFRVTVRLLAAILRASFPRATPMPERRRVARRSPVLVERFAAQIQAAERLSGELLAERLDCYESHGVLPDGVSREDAAQALIIFAGGVMKYAARTSPESVFGDDGDPAAIDRAIDVFRTIMKETP